MILTYHCMKKEFCQNPSCTLTTLSYPDLLNKCEQVYQGIALTAEQAKTVEEKTRDQSGSKLWFQQRTGRVTALRSVLHTKVTNIYFFNLLP